MHVHSPRESKSQPPPPRARAILEFVDLSKPPIVYVASDGSDEQDEVLRQEILKRWSCG